MYNSDNKQNKLDFNQSNSISLAVKVLLALMLIFIVGVFAVVGYSTAKISGYTEGIRDTMLLTEPYITNVDALGLLISL